MAHKSWDRGNGEVHHTGTVATNRKRLRHERDVEALQEGMINRNLIRAGRKTVDGKSSQRICFDDIGDTAGENICPLQRGSADAVDDDSDDSGVMRTILCARA